jgi:hypothetical protein
MTLAVTTTDIDINNINTTNPTLSSWLFDIVTTNFLHNSFLPNYLIYVFQLCTVTTKFSTMLATAWHHSLNPTVLKDHDLRLPFFPGSQLRLWTQMTKMAPTATPTRLTLAVTTRDIDINNLNTTNPTLPTWPLPVPLVRP